MVCPLATRSWEVGAYLVLSAQPCGFLGWFTVSCRVVLLAPAAPRGPGRPGEVPVRPPGLAPNSRGPCDNLNLRSRQVPLLSRPSQGNMEVTRGERGTGERRGTHCPLRLFKVSWAKSQVKGGGWELGTIHAQIVGLP